MDKPKKYEERLMEVFDFDEADLEANRIGDISPEQRKFFLQRVIIFGLLTVGTILLSWTTWRRIDLILLVLSVVFSAGFGFSLMQHYLDFIGRAAVVEGYLQQNIYNGRYTITVENRSFRARSSVFLVFKNGDPYRIYYAPYSKRILSVEWLRDDNLL